MKLTGASASQFFTRPDRAASGILLFGMDPTRVALRRKDLIAALIGSDTNSDMQLTRLTGAELRSDPARLLDAIKSSGFFAADGPRAVLVEDATDGLTATFEAALTDWQPGDAHIVATAKSLPARSKLRKLFEAGKTSYAIGIYDDPPSRAEIEALMAGAGLSPPSGPTGQDIDALARALSPGDFRQMLEKLALFKHGDAGEITPADIAAVAPVGLEAEIDDILDAVAGAEPAAIGPLMARLGQQGVGPVALCLAAERHFRALYGAAIHPGGPVQGVAGLRPPVFGPRRDKLIRQAGAWGRDRLEYALGVLIDTDLTLRSTAKVPEMALVERALIRLAMLPRSR